MIGKSEDVFQKDCFSGYVVFITGGGSGIGLGICESFAQHGASLAIMGRTESRLHAARARLLALGAPRVLTVQGDVRDFASCERAVAACLRELGHLDVLINNAAGNFLSPLRRLSPNAFKAVIDIDLVGSFHMSLAAHKALAAAGSGGGRPAGASPSIINITATLHYGATHWQGHPSAAKAGIDALTRSMALEWAPLGVRSNGVAPGPIQGTEGMRRLMGVEGEDVGKVDFVPTGRMGFAKDIALAVLFLASPSAKFVNGTTMVVDGGAHLYRPPLVDEETLEQMRKKAAAAKK